MENWIGAYRLPSQQGLGVERGEGLEGGGSPIPGTTPSPNLLNQMWNHAIKVEQGNHGIPNQNPPSSGSIKGRFPLFS